MALLRAFSPRSNESRTEWFGRSISLLAVRLPAYPNSSFHYLSVISFIRIHGRCHSSHSCSPLRLRQNWHRRIRHLSRQLQRALAIDRRDCSGAAPGRTGGHGCLRVHWRARVPGWARENIAPHDSWWTIGSPRERAARSRHAGAKDAVH